MYPQETVGRVCALVRDRMSGRIDDLRAFDDRSEEVTHLLYTPQLRRLIPARYVIPREPVGIHPTHYHTEKRGYDAEEWARLLVNYWRLVLHPLTRFYLTGVDIPVDFFIPGRKLIADDANGWAAPNVTSDAVASERIFERMVKDHDGNFCGGNFCGGPSKGDYGSYDHRSKSVILPHPVLANQDVRRYWQEEMGAFS